MADVWYFINLAYELMSPGTGLHPTRQGMVFGLLGVNGAGKTTSFKLMSGHGACDALRDWMEVNISIILENVIESQTYTSHTHHIT